MPSSEQRHFDERTSHTDLSRYSWQSGAQTVDPSTRRPYLYLEQLLQEKCASGTLLDCGCGQGVFSIFPVSLNTRVIGIDISQASLRISRMRGARHGVIDRYAVANADVERMPFRDNTFDGVMSLGLLSCVDIGQTVTEMWRVLKPGGFAVVIDTLGHNPVLNLRRAWGVMRGRRTSRQWLNTFKQRDTDVLARRFDIVSIRYFNLTSLMLGISPFRLLPISAREQMAGLLDTLDAYLLDRGFVRRFAFKIAIVAKKRP